MSTVFSVNLVYEKELNLMLKVSETSSQAAVGLSLRGTDILNINVAILNWLKVHRLQAG